MLAFLRSTKWRKDSIPTWTPVLAIAISIFYAVISSIIIPMNNLEVSSESHEQIPPKLGAEDLAPHSMKPGEACVVVQRHRRYETSEDSERSGSLTTEAEEDEWNQVFNYFKTLLDSTPPEERANIKVYFIASDSDYKGQGGERSYETAVVAQQAAEAAFRTHEVDPNGSIVSADLEVRGGYAQIEPMLREPQIFIESRDFVAFLRERYPDNFREMMSAYEDDRHRDVRVAMGAEGPNELADRLAQSISGFAQVARGIHADAPEARVVVWAVSHYDTISPFVKRDVLRVGIEPELPVDYGGGFSIEIDPDGQTTAKLGSKTYPYKLKALN